ncbi:MAG TPA: 16S rRNA (cytosine(1402)-N(4))-methyltransferase RsmH [Gemmatimonadales bacterium]|nr:16S rRNA (cytosine(1402)-N(4))-methyltransferase RsmH [Gemmatimonadales bacterium]
MTVLPDAHLPVLAERVAAFAAGARRVVDATLGDGGHAEGFLAAGARVLGIDRDPAALARAQARLGGANLELLGAPYASPEALAAVAEFAPELVLLDLGVSSRQLDDPALGFTFRPGAPLDMRMSRAGPGAADLLATAAEAELARVFHDYGDEPRARRLAAEVVRRRSRSPFRTSDDLVNAIRAVLGPRSGPGDFARLFQAVRIAVNGELDGLAVALPAFRDALAPGGRLAVISYHSGEDRLAKHAFRDWARDCVCPPGQPICTCRGRALGRLLTRKAIEPGPDERAANPRARSARLRVFQVNDAP